MTDAVEFFDSLDRSTGCYEFDEFRVVRSMETGALFYGTDSGCSCPIPFDNFQTLADWTPITNSPQSLGSFETDLFKWAEGSEGASITDCMALVAKVKAALKDGLLRSHDHGKGGRTMDFKKAALYLVEDQAECLNMEIGHEQCHRTDHSEKALREAYECGKKETRKELDEAKRTIQGEMSDPNGTIWEAHAAEKKLRESAEKQLKKYQEMWPSLVKKYERLWSRVKDIALKATSEMEVEAAIKSADNEPVLQLIEKHLKEAQEREAELLKAVKKIESDSRCYGAPLQTLARINENAKEALARAKTV